MPAIDMPLKDLKNYMGISEKPLDFDSFWDSQLEELQKLEVNLEIIEANFKSPCAKCYDLYFTGNNGARIYSKLITPVNIEHNKIPAIIAFHGYQGNSGEWSNYFKYAASGICVAVMDCRGQAGKSEDVGGVKGVTSKGNVTRGLIEGKNKLLYKDIFLDTVLLTNIIMNMNFIDENRIATLGDSQGGALALVCASLESRVKKVFSIYPFLCDFKRVMEMDLGGEAYDDLRRYFKFIDPTHETEEYVFETLSYIDVQNFVNRIKGEVTMATGLLDIICPPSTQFAAYNKIKSKKHMIIYPEYGHENIDYGLQDKIYEWAIEI